MLPRLFFCILFPALGNAVQTTRALQEEDRTLRSVENESTTADRAAQIAGNHPADSRGTGHHNQLDSAHSSGRRSQDPSPSKPHQAHSTVEEDTVTLTTFHASGNTYTLALVSREPFLNGQTLTPGQTVAVGTRTIALETSAIYINSDVWAVETPESTSAFKTSPRLTTTKIGHTFPFTIYDDVYVTTYTYDAHTVSDNPDEVVVDDYTLTAGQPGTVLDWWMVSLRADGSLVTASFEPETLAVTSSTSTTSEVTPTPTAGEFVYPTTAVLWTPSGSSGAAVSAGVEAGGSWTGRGVSVWMVLGSFVAVATALCV